MKVFTRIRKIGFDTFYRVSILVLILLLTSTVFYNHTRIENLQTQEDIIIPYDAFAKIEIFLTLERSVNGQAQTAELSSTGSGSVIDILDGYSIVLTANHVCNPFENLPVPSLLTGPPEKSIQVTGYYGSTYHAEVLYNDKDYDLCLLEVEGVWAVPIPIAKNPGIIGEKIYNMAAPTGFFASGMVPLLEGFNSGNIGPRGYEDTVYTIPTKGGSSGSPVLNSEGEVIGVIHSAINGIENIAIACTWDELDSFLFRYESLFKGF